MTDGSEMSRKSRKASGASTGPLLLALEKRIAFDGAGAAVAAKAAKTAAADLFHKTTQDSGVRQSHAGAVGDARESGRLAHGRLGGLFDNRLLTDLRQAGKHDRSVVFIETDVPDIKDLVKNIDPHTRIVLLDPTKDGVDAIADYLAAHRGMKNVYVFSHGSEAQLNLGRATLDSASMNGRYAADLAKIRQSLAPDADILVYGCDFAKNADGDSAARLLSKLTGANVAASTNLTGGTAAGGDFLLEEQIGRITAPNVLSLHLADSYDGLLANQDTGAFTMTTGTSGTATSSSTVATAYTADGAVKVVVTVTPASGNTSGSIKTTTGATFDSTAPAGSYSPSKNGQAALEQTIVFGTNTANGAADGANTATITIAFYDAKTGAAISVTNPLIDIDRLGGDAKNSSGALVSNSSMLTLTSGGSLTKLGASSNAFNVTSTQIYETVNTPVGGSFSSDASSDPAAGTSAGMVQVNGTYSTVTFNWSRATNSLNGSGDRVDFIFSADTALSPNGTLPNKAYTDGQSGVSIATAQGFSNPSGLSTAYSASGLPAGLAIDPNTGVITGTIDHDASKNAASTTGSGAALDGTYTVTVTATNSANNAATQTFTIDSTNQAPIVGTKTANQTNNDGDAIAGVNAAAAFSDPNGDTLTYSASGLPAGLSISSAGLITGTVAKNAAPGTYPVTVTATDDKGAATTETFSWVIKDVPPTKSGTLPNQTYTDGQAGISISTSQGFSDSIGNTLTYSAAGLPAGLTIDATTGKITGTIDHDASKNAPSTTGSGATLDGKYTITVTADDGLGGTATQTFTIDSKNTAPSLGTKTANQTNSDGDTITAVNAAAFSDPNGDPLTYTASNLPAGLTISSAGLISGTVAKNAAPGTYAVVVTATDDKGAATSETFNWVIKDVPPTANGTLPNQTYTDGQAGIAISTSQGFNDSLGNTLSYSAAGLPAGLSIDATTGKITGTIDHHASKNAPTTTGSGATLDGKYTVTVTASDGLGGTATQTFTIDSKNSAPTLGTKTANQTNNDGDTITAVNAAAAFADANGDPLTYSASNLPAGLAINAGTGVISGTVARNAAPGTHSVTVTATDDKGAATSETFSWVVKDVPPTASGALANQTYADGQSGISISTSQGFNDPVGNALTYSAAGLPAGLTIDPATGKITGTIDHDASKNAPTTSGSGATLDGKYTVTVTASDGLGGTATQVFTIDSKNTAPTVGTKTADQTNNDGDTIMAVNAAAAFTDGNGDPLTYTASNLPAGLTISATGAISGKVANNAAPGTYAVVVTATDDKGATATETFNWTIKDVPPTTNGTLANQTYTDGQTGIAISTSQGFNSSLGNPLTYSAAGLPAGLAIDPTTGKITGTVDHDASKNAPTTSGTGATLDGTYAVAVTASDGLGGTATQTFTIDSKNSAPTVGTKTVDQSNSDGDTITPVNTASAFSDQNGDSLSYTASNLPAGLTISSAGIISGKIANNAAPGIYAVVVTATDDKGATTTETFNWVVKDVPPTSSGTLANQVYTDGQSGVSISTAQGFNSPLGNSLTYTAAGLPSGLTIDPTTGKITGTVDHDASKNAPTTTGSGATLDGTYTVVVTASDGLGGTATQTFKIDATNQAPVVGTATGAQTSSDGQTITLVDASRAFSDPNTGDVLTYTASNLPAGLTIDATTGLISGTVARNATPGTYQVRVIATDDKGAATRETFSWTIANVPPTATGTLPNQSYADAAANISISTSQGFASPNGAALTYAASGLPLGLSIDQTTGKITGQLDHDASKNAPVTAGAGATLDGTYTVTVTAIDGQGGKATQTFTIDATNNAPTVAAQTPDQHGADGQKVSLDGAKAFADQNTGDALTYAATGLPGGLTIDANSGLITGTIDTHASTTGPYTVTITATDDKGAATAETFTWSVDNVPPVATPPLPDRAAYDGSGITITTSNGFTNPNNLAYTYTATGLPAGLTIDAATGIISGTLDHDASIHSNGGGIYTIAVTANDGQGGSATNTFHLTASNQAPVVATKTTDQANHDGEAITPVDASKAFSDPNGDTLTYGAANLPAGLSIDPITGKITGTVAANAKPGAYAVTVTATDDKGVATPETFTWTITDAAPVRNGTMANRTYADSTPGISIDASTAFTSPNGLALSYSATGLPTGLMIDPSTGKITGTLDHDASKDAPSTTGSGATLDGKYTVTVTADDGQGGTATQTFTIDATNDAPLIETNTANQRSTEGDSVSLNAATAFADPNAGDKVTYTSSSLPSGLTIDADTGVISGTVATGDANGSPYTVMVTATDDKGAATTETFSWTITPMAPGVVSPIPNVSTFDGKTVSIDTASHFDNVPTSYSATGLPPGLTIDALTGKITGTLDHDASSKAPAPTGSGATLDGTYTIVVTASNAGGSADQTFKLDAVNQAPTVSGKTADQASATGQTIPTVDASAAFADPSGDPLIYSAVGLPPGLSIDSAGKITGTVSKTAPGTYSVIVKATDDKGAATTETFTWTVSDLAPTANGTLANKTYADATSGISIATSGAFTSPNGLPLVYSANGLPAGLAIDPTTGTITGQLDHDASLHAPSKTGSGATLDGKYLVTVTASDGQGGRATQTFTIDATNNAPTIVAQTADQHGADGQKVSLDASAAFKDANTGDRLTYSASNLPTGLSIDPNTGLVTGTIDKRASANGPYTVSITATDDKGAAKTETFTFAVDNVAPTATPPLPDRSLYDGSVVNYTTANGFTNPNGLPLTYRADGLPPGLSINPTTGVITGTLDHDASAKIAGGKYTVAVTVDDGQGGAATNTFHFTASNQAPVVGTKTTDQSNKNGEQITPVDTTTVFTDPNPGDTLTYSASNLPAGLSIDPATGRITGTIAGNATPGAYYVTVTATDEKGAATPETFNWFVGDVPPTAVGTLANHTYADSTGGVHIDTATGFSSPNNLPLTYSVTGLPTGLTIDSSTGVISGFIGHNSSKNAPLTSGAGATLDGTYTVTVTADDGQGGRATQTFKIDATNNAPVVGSKTADQHSVDGAVVSLNAAQAFSDPNTGDTLTFTAKELPPGLTIDPATGKITGTIDPGASAHGPYSVAVTATDNKGAPTTETFQWIVDDKPPTAGAAIEPATAADGTAIAPIDTASHFDNPNGLPLTYTAAGLPAGLSIDPASGRITGTIGHDASKNAPVTSGSGATLDGTYTITVTADDGQGGKATQTFTFDATNDAPVVGTTTSNQHNIDGAPVSLDTSGTFSDPNIGDTLTYDAKGLPAGLSIDPATGKITGTIGPKASGDSPYTVLVTATDDKSAATTETFIWVVDNNPPTAGSAIPAMSAADGNPIAPIDTAGHFDNPNGLPLTYTAKGLPDGLSIDPTTGKISGTLDHDASTQGVGGKYTVTVTVDDGQRGTATQTFTIDATNAAPVVTTKTADQHGVDSAVVSLDTASAFVDPNTGDKLTYSATGLPHGLTIDPSTGRISGTIDPKASKPGSYSVHVTATDDKYAATTETFTWVVDNNPPTAGTSIPAVSAKDGSAIAAIDTANHFDNPNGLPLTYTATGLPKGLSIDPATGKITGTLDHDASENAPVRTGSGATLDGTYAVTVTVKDGQGGVATQTFTIDATNTAPVVGTKTANQHNVDGAAVLLDTAAAFSDPNTGDTLTFKATGLPKGLAIDPATGRISGTIDPHASKLGPYAVQVTATDDKGAATVETFTWVVDNKPPTAGSTISPVTAADGTAIAPIDTATHFHNPNGLPLIYAATGLPAGLSIDPATGKISGTLDHDASENAPVKTGSGATLNGTYTVTVTADDGQGGKATQVLTIDATNGAPVVGTKTADQHNADGSVVFVSTAPAFGDPNIGDVLTYAAKGLPKGLVIDPTTGRITGTIDAKASGHSPYTVVVTATDDKGAATTETFTWVVDNNPPTAGRAIPPATAADGTAIATIDMATHFHNPNGLPLTYAAKGLPAGLSIDPATGKISGTLDHDASKNAPVKAGSGATLDGTYTVTVMASDGQGGRATQTFTIDATNDAPVVGTKTSSQHSVDSAAVSVGTAPAFSDPNTGDKLTYAVKGLPKGLAIDSTTGRITGTIDPTASGHSPYAVVVTATDDKGAATTETFTWVVDNKPPTAGTAIPPATAADGTAIAPVDTASHFHNPNGLPLTFTAAGLPPGLSIDPTTGKISGTLGHDASKTAPVRAGMDGTYTITVTARDGQGGAAVQIFTFDARNSAPIFGTRTTDQRNADRASIVLDTAPAFHDPNTGDVLTYAASGLPKGLTIDPTTGRITGTIDPRASAHGPYTIQVTATDDKGAATSETFSWIIDNKPPTAGTAIPPATAADGTAIAPIDAATHFHNPNGLPLTYTAKGLPPGLSIDPTTGKISGTLDHDASKSAPVHFGMDGTYTVTVTADDGQGGKAVQTFTFDATNDAPVVLSRTPDQHGVEDGRVSLDAAMAFADANPGDTLTYAATGLPKGLSIDPTTGRISGTIDSFASRTSPYQITVTATDDKGAATTETFAWTVVHLPPTATTPIDNRVAGDGTTIPAIDTAGHFDNPTGAPLTFSATGLPPGLSIDPATGRITGTLDPHAARHAPEVGGQGATLDGTYTVTVTVDDGRGGTAQQTFTIDAVNNAPVVTGRIPDQAGVSGNPASVDAGHVFSDPNAGDTITFTATGLPPGLSMDPTTGRITGTPTSDPTRRGPYQVTVTATDSEGATASETFSWNIEPVPAIEPVRKIEPVAPSILPLQRVLPPVLVQEVAVPQRLAVKPAVLEAVNQTSGDEEQSIAIHVDDIVLSTVNNVQPLERHQPLDTPGAGIVRSGAGTNERGDRFLRTQAALSNEIGGFSTPTYIGSSLRDAGLLTGKGATTINVETTVRDGVLTMSFDNASAIACVVPVARYEVTLADGRALPSWLHADARGVVTGRVPPGAEVIEINVKATLTNGVVIERLFSIRADQGTIDFAAPVSQRHAGLSLSDMLADAHDTKTVRTRLAHLL